MPGEQPNVVFVLADQMRAEAMGCMGNTRVRTPTLDEFAEEGVLFPRAYSPSPVCGPARGSIMTGLYPHAHGIPFNHERMRTDVDSLAERFSRAGYRTGYVGKWHLDGDTSTDFVPPGPRRQGFDYWEAFNRGHAHMRGHPQFSGPDSCTWIEGYQPAVQTDIAGDFVESHRETDPDRPFFLYLSWGPPHGPWEMPDEYHEMYDPDSLELRPNVPETADQEEVRQAYADYYGAVTSLDDQFERLLATLEEQGIAEDTVVVFTSDHGEMLGSHDRWTKGIPLEESIHVPLLLRAPGDTVDRDVLDTPVSLADLMPTLLSLCGVSPPDGIHGLDLTPSLADSDREPDREGVYVEGWNPYMDSRTPFDTPWRAIRTRQHLLSIDSDLETECFYDTEDDPYQLDNRRGEEGTAETEATLRDQLFETMRSLDDSRFLVRTSRRDLREYARG